MEDGVALAICLEKAGKRKVQTAIRAYEAIRYERVHKAQQTGVTTREQWHKADWDKIRKDPTSLHLKRDAWLLDYDEQTHSYAVIDETMAKFDEQERADLGGSGKPSEKASGLPIVVQSELVGIGQ